MQQRLSIITLGVVNVERATAFYEAMGWKKSSISEEGAITFFQLNGIGLSLFNRRALAKDSNQEAPDLPPTFRDFSIAYNTNSKEKVQDILAQAYQHGGKIVKPAEDAFWGGYSGYFTDPDGHLWEVAWNPFITLVDNGEMQFPE